MIRNPPKQNSIGNYLGLYITQIEKTNSEREPRQGRFRHPPRRVEHDFVRPIEHGGIGGLGFGRFGV